jgi:hypothetical protein
VLRNRRRRHFNVLAPGSAFSPAAGAHSLTR